MNDVFRLLLLLLAVCPCACLISNREGRQDRALEIYIVPQGGPWDEREIHLTNSADHFHVVLTNVSGKPQRVWKEGCSWGYSALSFELTDEKGSKTSVYKKLRSWFSNSPDAITIPSQGSVVFNVSFSPEDWENSPLSAETQRTPVTMRAIYDVKKDSESDEFRVWTGRMLSQESNYIIVR